MLLVRHGEGRVGLDFAGSNLCCGLDISKLERCLSRGIRRTGRRSAAHLKLPAIVWEGAIEPQILWKTHVTKLDAHAFGCADFIDRGQCIGVIGSSGGTEGIRDGHIYLDARIAEKLQRDLLRVPGPAADSGKF